jgi:hypothetical protein
VAFIKSRVSESVRVRNTRDAGENEGCNLPGSQELRAAARQSWKSIGLKSGHDCCFGSARLCSLTEEQWQKKTFWAEVP